jgi:hypothetical protein
MGVVARPEASRIIGPCSKLIRRAAFQVDYECRHPMSGPRSVEYCAYYGIQGRRVVYSENGESCSVITFLRIDWPQLFGMGEASRQ